MQHQILQLVEQSAIKELTQLLNDGWFILRVDIVPMRLPPPPAAVYPGQPHQADNQMPPQAHRANMFGHALCFNPPNPHDLTSGYVPIAHYVLQKE